jgi:RimK family alpha-L-glutamate ligase
MRAHISDASPPDGGRASAAGTESLFGTTMTKTPRIAVFTDKIDWHVDETTLAFDKLGVEAIPVRLAACRFDTSHPFGIAIPGFRASLPDAAIVRAIGDGSLEMITMRLGLLHALESLGAPVFNGARAIERCTDKAMASFTLSRAGIGTPQTFATQSLPQARSIVRRECENGPLVLKPLFGAQGWGLRLIRDERALPAPEEIGGVYYLQRFVSVQNRQFEDKRILISRGRVVAAMLRRSNHWITNVRQGAKPVAIEPSPQELDIALQAAKALGAFFAGVDLIAEEDGAPLVLEVNSMAGWSGLQSVTSFSIAQRLASDVLAAIERAERLA